MTALFYRMKVTFRARNASIDITTKHIVDTVMHVNAAQMKVSIYQLMLDPEFYLFNYLEKNQSSEFLIVREQLLDIAPFTDIRLEPHARGQFTVPSKELALLVDSQQHARPAQHYVFHHAFVCSTLFARCLAQSDAFFSLKEPQIIRRLADLARSNRLHGKASEDKKWGRFLNTHLQLLAKNYTHGNSVIIKATNMANNLLSDIICHAGASRIIYMHCPLRDFLVSNIKKTKETQDKIPTLLKVFTQDADFYRQFPRFKGHLNLSLLQNCALLWLVSNSNFLHSIKSTESNNVATLNMLDFLAAPRQVLAASSRFFGHQASATELDLMCHDSVMNRHAKDPNLVYSSAIRAAENRRIEDRYGKQISAAIAWLNQSADSQKTECELSAYSLLSGKPVSMRLAS